MNLVRQNAKKADLEVLENDMRTYQITFDGDHIEVVDASSEEEAVIKALKKFQDKQKEAEEFGEQNSKKEPQ
jgi:hypothetical protein